MKGKGRIWLVWVILAVLLLAGGSGFFWWKYSNTVPLDEYLTRINRYMTGKEYEQALYLCKEALEKYPQEGTLYYKKAQIYQAQGETEMAIGTLDYGYKETGLEELKQLREEYDETEEEDAPFSSPQLASPEEQSDAEEVEEYKSYELPQITLPEVEPLPTPTPTPSPTPVPTPEPSEAPAESQPTESTESSEESSAAESSEVAENP